MIRDIAAERTAPTRVERHSSAGAASDPEGGGGLPALKMPRWKMNGRAESPVTHRRQRDGPENRHKPPRLNGKDDSP